MRAVKSHYRRVSRTMRFEHIFFYGPYVSMDLIVKQSRMPCRINLFLDHPAMLPFAGKDGKFKELKKLRGQETVIYFDDFQTNNWIEWAEVVRIKKVKGKA